MHHRSSFEICMAHFTAKETAAVCKTFNEEEQASSGRIIHERIIHGKQRHNIRTDDIVSLETAEIVNTETQDSCESLPFVTSSRRNCAVRRGGNNFKIETRNVQAEIKRQLEENGELKSCMFLHR